MDLDTSEKVFSLIAAILAIGGTLYAIYRKKINRFIFQKWGKQQIHYYKKCPRCGARVSQRKMKCPRCGWVFRR